MAPTAVLPEAAWLGALSALKRRSPDDTEHLMRAESAPTGVTLGRTGIRVIADISGLRLAAGSTFPCSRSEVKEFSQRYIEVFAVKASRVRAE